METTDSPDTGFQTLIKTVYSLILLSIVTFLVGFLQNTEFGFVIYILYFILLCGGLYLIFTVRKSEATGLFRAFLLLTGISSTLYFVFFLIALIGTTSSGAGLIEMLTEMEGIFYLSALAFLIGALGSIVHFHRLKKSWQH